MTSRTQRFALTIALGMALIAAACDSEDVNTPSIDRNDLDSMPTLRMTIEGHPFEVWLALTTREQTLGLMHVDAGELRPTLDGTIRGMLFVFGSEQLRGFWLDIAYMRADGTIVKIHTMTPFDTSTYPSVEPAQFALEVPAGTLVDLGISEGDTTIIPL